MQRYLPEGEESIRVQRQELKTVPIGADTYRLISSIIASGVCHDEEEVITKAVRTFFVAVSPAFPEEIFLKATKDLELAL